MFPIIILQGCVWFFFFRMIYCISALQFPGNFISVFQKINILSVIIMIFNKYQAYSRCPAIFASLLIILNFMVPAVFAGGAQSGSFEVIKSLDLQDSTLRSLRNDVRTTLRTVKGKRSVENLPELKIYKYKVKKNENFWMILSRTSLNIDTISTLNSLSCPGEVSPGKEIFLCNMRGIVYRKKQGDTIKKLAERFEVEKEYICSANRINGDEICKDYVFIPAGMISNIEKSLFLGSGFISPLKHIVRTSNFGRRIDPFHKRFDFHSGIDLRCSPGTKIYAARSGKVVFTGYKGGYGLLVVIKHENDYSTYYGHLKRALVKKGQRVKRGEVIALSGNSGRSTGPHLHFEVRKEGRPLNPGLLTSSL